MKISVIVSTYNQPEWLAKVLEGYVCQEDENFEIVIADDGSGAETAAVIKDFQKQNPNIPLQHIWHADAGFRKTVILNKATVAARGEYLVFTDGDCIPRSDFLSIHRRYAQPGRYLSGGYFKLPMETSLAIGKEAIRQGHAFRLRWLKQKGLAISLKSLRIAAPGWVRGLLDVFIPTKKTWNGNNSSAFKAAILKVNGHDERMLYGGEDVEMGYRLRHSGVRPKRIRYRALVMHLDHARGYADPQSIARNLEIRRATLSKRSQWTDYGIVKASKSELNL